MSATDVLTPDPATSAERAACTAALQDFVAASTAAEITSAAAALLTAVEAAPAGRLREMARERVVEAADVGRLYVTLGGGMPGVPGLDLSQSLATMACALAVRAINGGAL